MGRNVEPIINNADLAAILIKGNADPDSLSAEERLRYSTFLIGSFRRLEAVYVQHKLGSIDEELKEGFEVSLMAVLRIPFGEQCWESAKVAFYRPFSDHVDLRLASGKIPGTHPSMMLEERSDS
jgi:hypothetical protein